MENIEIRLQMKRKRLTQREVAEVLGMHPCSLSRLLRNEMDEKHKELVKKAIDSFGSV